MPSGTNFDRRVTQLEGLLFTGNKHFIWKESDETELEAIERYGASKIGSQDEIIFICWID